MAKLIWIAFSACALPFYSHTYTYPPGQTEHEKSSRGIQLKERSRRHSLPLQTDRRRDADG